MSEPGAARRRWRVWLTLSELVGVLALLIAGLNFWEGHHARVLDTRRQASASEAHAALVLEATPDPDGGRLALQPMNPAQAVQSQRYLFPRAVLGHAMEVDAARPQIDLGWIADGLRADIVRRRKAGTAAAQGEAEMPVGVVTTYVEDGQVLTDASLYRVGYSWRSRFLGGPALVLQGLSLARRHLSGGLQGAVESSWTRQAGA